MHEVVPAGSAPVVAIQGEAGSFSHAAAVRVFGPAVRLASCADFDELFQRVEAGRVDAGVVPIENSLAGSVHENYDRLSAYPLHVVGEAFVRVRLCLIGTRGLTLAQVRRAASHPVALAQCRRFFARHRHLTPVPAYDTAGSVRDLMAGRLDADAAVASALAARLYGAEVMAADIEDDRRNFTRFLVVAAEPAAPDTECKASLSLTLAHTPGSLHAALQPLAAAGVNLTKIQSRPIPGQPWEYRFYVDVVTDRPESMRRALDELRTRAIDLQLLGVYAPGAPQEESAAGRRE